MEQIKNTLKYFIPNPLLLLFSRNRVVCHLFILAFGLSDMDNPLPAVPKDVKILETAEDIQERRDQVLSRYGDFKTGARAKREKLEDSRRFQVRIFIREYA